MRNFLIGLIALGFISISAFVIYNSSSKKNVLTQNPTPGQNTQSQSNEIPKTFSASSRYVEFSPTVLQNSSSTRRVLYFYANWCPSCKVANEDFLANPDKIPEDVVVIRTNYNDPNTDQEEKDLAKKYAITYQHTFVQIDAQGNQITKWNGGKIDELLKNII